MGSISINTNTIKSNIEELSNAEKYYLNKKTSFLASNFNPTSNIRSYLSKIQEIYTDISININKLKNYLKEYIEDYEALEKQMQGLNGTIKDEEARTKKYLMKH